MADNTKFLNICWRIIYIVLFTKLEIEHPFDRVARVNQALEDVVFAKPILIDNFTY